jgi:hypothetical protein
MAEIAKKRGRPPKVTQTTSKNGVFVTKLQKQIDNTPITRTSAQGWINWGQRNNYPNLLLDLYSQSPTHHAACDFAVASICGNGVDFEKMKLNGDEVVPNTRQTWDDVIKGLATDYILYGSYAIMVIMNRDGVTYSFYHIPMDRVRWSDFDEFGDIPSYWIARDWTEIGQYPPTEVIALDLSNDEKLEKGVQYLYVYREYTPTQTYYTQPHYAAAIKSIESEIQYVNYDLKNIVNGFAPAGVLTLPSVDDEKEKDAIINEVTKLFTGSDNANSVMINFRNNIEGANVEYTPFSKNQGSFNFYADADLRTLNRILEAHQIPNASLIGHPDVTNSGFASEADKLELSYQLYNKLTGNKNRMAVVRTLNQLFKLNGIETQIEMKPLSFVDFGNDADYQERTDAVGISEDDTKDQEE